MIYTRTLNLLFASSISVAQSQGYQNTSHLLIHMGSVVSLSHGYKFAGIRLNSAKNLPENKYVKKKCFGKILVG